MATFSFGSESAEWISETEERVDHEGDGLAVIERDLFAVLHQV